MTNAIKDLNSIDSSNKTHSTQYKTHFKVSGLVNPIFKKIKDLSSRHLGSSTYLIANKEDKILQKVLKVFGWVFLISPMVLITVYLYDTLKDLYHQQVEKYSRMEKCSDENSNPARVNPFKAESPKETEIEAEPSTAPIKTTTQTLQNETTEDSSETIIQEEENGFEIINMSPDLLEEMKNASPTIFAGRTSLWEKMKTFSSSLNPFSSETRNVITPTNNSIVHENIQESSLKNFEIVDPIIVDHKDTKINTTDFSIDQIKKDLSRMKIFVNGDHCSNIQDFIGHLGLTLNTEETDILPSDNSVIPKILHFSHQGIFAPGTIKVFRNLSDSKLFPSQTNDIPLTLHIHWDPESSEQAEIIAEISFQIKSSEPNGTTLPNKYVLRIKHSLDKEEITFTKNIQEDNDFEMIESSQAPESDNESFEELEDSDNVEENINHNRDIAFLHLKDQINSCLTSTVTSEYLHSLKIKYPNFVYNDRLMFPGSITTDEMANSLNNLKNNNSNSSLIFLPFLVNGCSVDHAVVAVINLSNETIEYFDPKGQNCLLPTRTEKKSSKNVFDFLTKIGQKVISPTFSKKKIVHNKKHIPQGFLDNVNCGAFCLQFIDERMNHSFDDIENGIVGREVDTTRIRHQLASQLIENTYQV